VAESQTLTSCGVTIVTATARLSRALADRHARERLARGASAWEQPRVLPWHAWLSELYGLESARRAPRALLAPAQEQALWEEVVTRASRGLELISPAGLARTAAEAWRLVHAHRIPLEDIRRAGAEDARDFVRFAMVFEERCDALGCVDAARVADAVAGMIRGGEITAPTVQLAGFEEFTPQQRDLFAAIEAAGGSATRINARARAGVARRVALPDGASELFAAASWVRKRLEANATALIGVVVPDLAARRARVEGVFGDVFFPGRELDTERDESDVFQIAVPSPLASQPVVQAALRLLDFVFNPAGFERMSAWLRSPFFGGAETERAARALLDARLRALGGSEWSMRRLMGTVATERVCPALDAMLRRLIELRDVVPARQGLARWAGTFATLLNAAGWPGERAPTRAEREIVDQWRELLDTLVSLDAVSEACHVGAALTALRRIAARTAVRPGAFVAPVQIMTANQTAGLEFDHLWVSGMRDDVWPPPAQPNPFLPIALQRRHGVPQATAALTREHAESVTRRWLAAADEVIVSYPATDGESVLRPSPLIVPLPEIAPEECVPLFPRLADAIYAARAREPLPDARAPAVDASLPTRGGTSVLKDYAACPFRAFARHRLGAKALDEPAPGLTAMERGLLVHSVLAKIWGELGDAARLQAIAPADLDALIAAHTRSALAESRAGRPALGAVFEGIERACIEKLARAWLDIERTRPPFRVLEREQSHAMEIGGLAMRARVDRVDELPDGSRIVIDYKTGKASANGWSGERPDEPQLPAYASFAIEGDVAGIAFACLGGEAPRFAGLARASGSLPGVRQVAGKDDPEPARAWDAMRASWRATLTRLAHDYRAGDARVDPKTPVTCRYCDLHTLCRVHEVAAAAGRMAADEDEEGEAHADD
jgi:probable DNA repair protein